MKPKERVTTGERPLPTPSSEVKMRFSPEAVKELEAIVTHYPDKKAALLPALSIAQREYGMVTPEAMMEVAVRLNRPFAEVAGVATFYTLYKTEPIGKHVIEVCTCLTCAVVGAFRLLDYLQEKLGIGPGETTPDGLFTIEEVECLNFCSAAPVIQIGDKYEGNLTPEKLNEIIDRLRSSEEPTITQMSNSVVKCQLHEGEV
jgi:NADH-quinone oxidoreductase subunit E